MAIHHQGWPMAAASAIGAFTRGVFGLLVGPIGLVTGAAACAIVAVEQG